MSYDDYDQDAAEARFDYEMAQLERIAELEELVRDMWFWCYEGHMDSESQDWQMKHIAKQRERIDELESLVKDMLFTIRLGSMSDLTDKLVLASWFNDFSKRASELGLLDGDAE